MLDVTTAIPPNPLRVRGIAEQPIDRRAEGFEVVRVLDEPPRRVALVEGNVPCKLPQQ